MTEPRRAEVLQPTPENLARAAELLRSGGLVAMPTETVYGLAGAANQPEALAAIFAAKERPTFDPLIVHVSWPIEKDGTDTSPLDRLEAMDLIRVSQLQIQARDMGNRLLRAFWPGPLTLVLPKSPDVPDLATSGLGTVALRMPRHPVARALIEAAGVPLAAPSANRFGRISPTRAEHVLSELGDRIPLILDGGPCEVGVESTVLLLQPDGVVRLLRPGGAPAEKIEAVLGHKLEGPVTARSHPGETAPQAAPGMLESHYAPRKKLILLPAVLENLSGDEVRALASQIPPGTPVGLLAFQGKAEAAKARLEALFGTPVAAVRVLSAEGHPDEAARKLFASLRDLDHSSAQLLLAEPCVIDAEGLGHAIQDRLRRAAAPR